MITCAGMPPTPGNAAPTSYPPAGTVYVYNDIVEFQCTEGFVLQTPGDADGLVSTCSEYGTWTPVTAQCIGRR